MTVADIMTEKVGYLFKEATLVEAAEMMRTARIGSIVVVEKGDEKLLPVGIVTDRDIVVEVVAEKVETRRLTVEDVMSRDIVTIPKRASVFSAVQIMERDGVRRLPVVDEKGELCGIVSADDIAGHLAVAIHSLSKVPGVQRTIEKMRLPEM